MFIAFKGNSLKMEDLVHRLIQEGLLRRNKHFNLRSGQSSDIYFDLKTVCGKNPGIRTELADKLYRKF